jgi:peroxiredoxin Q/BCP
MVGEYAEDFILKDQNGNKFQLYDNLDKRILLVFYPNDDTPVCNRQLLNYNDYLTEFEEKNIKIVGINTNSVKSHISFCNKLGIKFQLLSDINKEMSHKFKALNLFGINKRKLILIDTDKRIIFKKTVLQSFYLNGKRILKELKIGQIG